MGWKDNEQKVFNSLSDNAKEWVEKNVNRDPDNDLWGKSRDELIKMFPDGEDLNDRKLMNTFIWQEWNKLQSDELEPVNGNERSMWYRDVEPFYTEKGLIEPNKKRRKRIGEIFSLFSEIDEDGISRALSEAGVVFPEITEKFIEKLERKDPETFKRVFHGAKETYITNLISKVLVEFVKAGVFRFHYKKHFKGDFKFMDPRKQFRIIGSRFPRIMFYTEKEGLWWLCEYAAEKHGISAVASQGESGLLAVEYIYDDLMKAKAMTLRMGAITDYDPWGALIPPNLKEKFMLPIFYGGNPNKVSLDVLNKSEKDLDKFFTPEEKEKYKRDLRLYSQYKQSQVKEWVEEKGGGINGEWYGIHIDTANRQKLCDEVDRWVKGVKRKLEREGKD